MKQRTSRRTNDILNRIQSQFPIIHTPFHKLGKELGIAELDIYDTLHTLKKTKIIRRVGAIFDSQKLGFASCLVGVKVARAALEQVGGQLAKFDEITHCYARNHSYNLWFTLTCKSQSEITKILTYVKNIKGVIDLLYLPALKVYKIKTEFNLHG
ncbi:MAG: Lrp/AsnC family transcriptional regulator [bacterium]|nr:Lrp/AsnC family transcriptional regulator [bacterium]